MLNLHVILIMIDMKIECLSTDIEYMKYLINYSIYLNVLIHYRIDTWFILYKIIISFSKRIEKENAIALCSA